MNRIKKILALCLVFFLLPQTLQGAKGPGDLTPDQARELFKKSMSSLQNKEYESAIGGFQKIYESFPKQDPGPIGAYNAACACALLGKADDSVSWLEKAIAGGFCDVVQIRMDPDLQSVRKNPRFTALLGKLEASLVYPSTREEAGALEKGLADYLKSLEGAKQITAKEALSRMEKATVLVVRSAARKQASTGSGVLMKTAKGKYLVTAGHSLPKNASADPMICLPDGKGIGVTPMRVLLDERVGNFKPHLLNDDAPTDLGVARLNQLPADDSIFVDLAQEVKEGEPAYILGYPDQYGRRPDGAMGRAFTGGSERLTALTKVGRVKKTLKNNFVFAPLDYIHVPANQGSSGGPVFNSEGKLIGIFKTGYPRSPAFDCGCTTLTVIKALIDEIERDGQPK